MSVEKRRPPLSTVLLWIAGAVTLVLTGYGIFSGVVLALPFRARAHVSFDERRKTKWCYLGKYEDLPNDVKKLLDKGGSYTQIIHKSEKPKTSLIPQNKRGCGLAWSRLGDSGSLDPGSNPGSPTMFYFRIRRKKTMAKIVRMVASRIAKIE